MTIAAWLRALAIAAALTAQSGLVAAAPQVGWWWNPDQSGRGYFIESQNGIFFMAAYFYADDGRARWLVAGGTNVDPYHYSGRLLEVRNGQTLYGTYVPPNAPVDSGAVTVSFSDDTHGTIVWPGGTIAIVRENFDPGTASFEPAPGWWWNPDESGSGYSVEVQGGALFMVGFMYDDAGNPVWYLSAGALSTPTAYHGDLLQVAGGQTLSGPYHPPSSITTIGTLDIEFTAQNEATFTFTESPASGLARAPAKSGRSKVTVVKPQFTKPGKFVYPAAYFVSFFITAKGGAGGTSSSTALRDVNMQVSKVGTGGDVQFYAQRPGTSPSLVLDYEYNFADCRFVSTTSLEGVPFELTITPYAKYTLHFLVPAGTLPGQLKCKDSNDAVVLPFPGFEATFSGAVGGKDEKGTNCAGCIYNRTTVAGGPVTTDITYSLVPIP